MSCFKGLPEFWICCVDTSRVPIVQGLVDVAYIIKRGLCPVGFSLKNIPVGRSPYAGEDYEDQEQTAHGGPSRAEHLKLRRMKTTCLENTRCSV